MLVDQAGVLAVFRVDDTLVAGIPVVFQVDDALVVGVLASRDRVDVPVPNDLAYLALVDILVVRGSGFLACRTKVDTMVVYAVRVCRSVRIHQASEDTIVVFRILLIGD